MDKGNQDAQFFQMIIDSQTGEQQPTAFSSETAWQDFPEEGQLSVDVAESEKHVIIMTTIAGAKTDTLSISIHNDTVTIRGQRQAPVADVYQYFHQECFWGPFSRTIILPRDVDAHRARASYLQGVLTIRIPKREQQKTIPITILD